MVLLLILFSAGGTGGVAGAAELKPAFTRENGQSCGRTAAGGGGVGCVASQCYDSSVSREFSDWTAFEQGFFREELRRSGVLSQKADFTDLCPASRDFSPEERELLWLDFLKLMAGFESNYLWLTAYDDWVSGRVATERGFFQVSSADCARLPEVRADYCATHWPRTNARCALGIIQKLIRSRGGKALDAIAAHWGSMRSKSRNGEGGRRELLQKSFARHPACQTSQQVSRRSSPAAGQARPKYDRLAPGMYTDSDFIKARILPSYRPRPGVGCEGDLKDARLMSLCRRVLHWKHYEQVDRESAARQR